MQRVVGVLYEAVGVLWPSDIISADPLHAWANIGYDSESIVCTLCIAE